ncbi:hypothetical protein UFOVP707_5 [uncultured Caudovirales phage]|uniref:Uncharacterized protein n=1 Tax=uncultured Caudovirales phage TaxID=2100421 RepID=A0A6J5NIA3_9CAUD|nr:hypothetical protein UFOVP707_5 [uncultured Caudovirales phage]
MNLQFQVRTTFGRQRLYPANDAARTLCELLGTDTAEAHKLAIAKRLGMTIEILAEPIAPGLAALAQGA